MTMTNDAKFKAELTCRFKTDTGNLPNLAWSVKSLKKIAFQLAVFYQSIKCLREKSTEKLSFMTLKTDAKLEKKTDLWFGKCYEEFGKFSPEYLKVSKLRLWWDPFIQSRKCMSLKSAEELCVMTKKNIAKFLRETDLLFQNWLKEFNESWPRHPKILKICTLMGPFWLKHIIRAPHWVRLVRFLPYQIFLIKMSFLSFYSEYENEFRLPY